MLKDWKCSLTELILDFNILGNGGAIQLSTQLLGMKSELRKLSLGKNDIRDEGILEILK